MSFDPVLPTKLPSTATLYSRWGCFQGTELGVLSDKKGRVEDWSDEEGGEGCEDGEVSGCEVRNQLEVDSCEFFELLR